jgi:Flp pilus assembly protein CpaB
MDEADSAQLATIRQEIGTLKMSLRQKLDAKAVSDESASVMRLGELRKQEKALLQRLAHRHNQGTARVRCMVALCLLLIRSTSSKP